MFRGEAVVVILARGDAESLYGICPGKRRKDA
jgi:hypothetical protein